MRDKFQTVVIGSGVIGLAIARKFALAGQEVLILEANKNMGLETSFRNSAVIHAGIYYPSQSLKAKLCVAGQKELYKFCQEYQVPYKQIGKLIVATHEKQLPKLEALYNQALLNGVTEVKIISAREVHQLEPNVRCVAALYSPTTGIINGRELMAVYLRHIESRGGVVRYNSRMIHAETKSDGFLVTVLRNEIQEQIECDQLVNAAGLSAPEVGKSIAGVPPETIPRAYFAKGNYFKYVGPKSPFSRLVYPIPESAGLGIHATIDLTNTVRFGPDVEWVEELDYIVSPARKGSFLEEIRHYFPAIKEADLIPDFAGIRPKILPREQQPQDFVIQSEKEHGVRGLVNLYGMESPGLTSSLAIADYVESLLD